MILVDTSVWVDHLRWGLPRLATRLQAGEVLSLLQGLPAAVVASDEEVLLLIERDQLMGRGIGHVDVHLLASARLSRCRLWTQDRRLAAMAGERELEVPEAEPEAPAREQVGGPIGLDRPNLISPLRRQSVR